MKLEAARLTKLWKQRLWMLYTHYREGAYFFELVDMGFQLVCFGACERACVCACLHVCLHEGLPAGA
jgi:hypothetical protein